MPKVIIGYQILSFAALKGFLIIVTIALKNQTKRTKAEQFEKSKTREVGLLLLVFLIERSQKDLLAANPRKGKSAGAGIESFLELGLDLSIDFLVALRKIILPELSIMQLEPE